jgi:hypothetical protein
VQASSAQRRSERILAQAPVIVEGQPIGASRFVEPTRATVINAHGALISLMKTVTLRQKLVLRNPATQVEQECSVVYLGENQGGRTEVGVAFKVPAPRFWGLEKLPKSWEKSLPK